MRWTMFVLLVAALVACSDTGDTGDAAQGDDSGSASVECNESMEAAAAETDPAAANPLIIETLSACSSADEWLEALLMHPGAMGLTEDAEIGDLELQSACFGNEGTPVCEDAAEDGRL